MDLLACSACCCSASISTVGAKLLRKVHKCLCIKVYISNEAVKNLFWAWKKEVLGKYFEITYLIG